MKNQWWLWALGLIIAMNSMSFAQTDVRKEKDRTAEPVRWIDNNRYWKAMAKKGLTTLNPIIRVEAARYTGSALTMSGASYEDSPDIALFDEDSQQSENSVMVDPNNADIIINSNNSGSNPMSELYGANYTISTDGSQSWNGQKEGAGEANSGDPAVAIDLGGRHYVGYIHSNYGQGVGYSDDQGETWTNVLVADVEAGGVLDKNHLWVDNSLASPFKGNLYNAWTPMAASEYGSIAISHSVDRGESWSNPKIVSNDCNAGSHCQGVNVQTGPGGNVYAAYAIYDEFSDAQSFENAIGFSSSSDGGETWSNGKRVLENIRGVRNYTELGKNMRVNSFPVMAVDISTGPNSGNIYIAWANVGVPGANEGPGTDIYMIKSTDDGETWSDPIRINQDPLDNNSTQYMPWICCDGETGVISAVFYDDRNVGGAETEVFCANSFDGGETWEDFKVSDVAFTPAPIPGLAGGYMGDYLAISSRGGKVYPCWPDNRSGYVMTYCSPYSVNNLGAPFNLNAELNENDGQVNLQWEYEEEANFTHFVIYRNAEQITTTTEMNFTEVLDDYGYYTYKVTASYDPDGESNNVQAILQYGSPQIEVSPLLVAQSMKENQMATSQITVSNPGELELTYAIAMVNVEQDRLDYCDANGGGSEHIAGVKFVTIDQTSASDNYSDYTDLVAAVEAGESIPIEVTPGNYYAGDKVAVWVDWNIDGEFSDHEKTALDLNSSDVFAGEIVVPADVQIGNTRMRIRLAYNPSEDNPCGETAYGEVEDYGISSVNWLALNSASGVLAAGESLTHELVFNTTGLDSGNYQKNLVFSSNVELEEQPLVEVTLEVNNNPFPLSVSATPNEICKAELISLMADVENPEDCTFSWTSDPIGFTSDLQNPSVMVEQTTLYELIVNKGDEQSVASVLVVMNDGPVFSLGEDQQACSTASITLIAESDVEDLTYAWSTMETSSSIEIEFDSSTANADSTAIYTCTVMNLEGCSSTDEVKVKWLNCTGVEDVIEHAFKLYPNPASTKLSLAIFDEYKKQVEIRMYNVQGQLILREENQDPRSEHIYDIRTLPAGIYTFVLIGEGKISQEKIIISGK